MGLIGRWCGHCKRFKPIFEQTATMTQKTDEYINFGEIDCDANLAVCGYVLMRMLTEKG